MNARIFREAIARNVIIYAYDWQGKFVGMGSGVAIGKNKILTVSHLFGNIGIPVKIEVLYAEVQTTAKIAKEDGGKDGLAVIYTEDEMSFSPIKFSPNNIGQEILIYGNTPLMFDIPILTHLVRQITRKIFNSKTVVYDEWQTASAEIRTGFSGAGVYNSQGLTGLVWGFIDLGKGMSLIMINTTANLIEFTKEFF